MSPASAPNLESPLYRRAASPGGHGLETGAASTLQRLLSDWGESHLREVLLSIVESAGNERALTAPVIWAVSDYCSRIPTGLATTGLTLWTRSTLRPPRECEGNRKAVEPRAAIAAVLFERLKAGCRSHGARSTSVQDRRMAPRRTGVIRRPSDISSSRAAPRSIVGSADVSDLGDPWVPGEIISGGLVLFGRRFAIKSYLAVKPREFGYPTDCDWRCQRSSVRFVLLG